MRLTFYTLTILFALLCMYAAAIQLGNPKHKSPCLLMIAGGFVLICAIAACMYGLLWDWLVALIGCIAICVAAVLNGKADGLVHPMHHIIRAAFCALLIAGFYFL